MRQITKQLSAPPTWWLFTSRLPGPQSVRLSVLCCRYSLLSRGMSNSSPDPGTTKRSWSTGQAWMFSTGGWKIARGVNNYPFHENLALIFSSLIQVSLKHEIVAVPTVILFRAGKAVDRCGGLYLMSSIFLSWASKWEIVDSINAQSWRSERSWADKEGSKPRSICTCYPACCSQGTLPLVQCLVDETFDSPQEDLNTKLKRLINAHKCMLFMKVRKVLSVF